MTVKKIGKIFIILLFLGIWSIAVVRFLEKNKLASNNSQYTESHDDHDHEAEAPGGHDDHDHEAESPGGHDGHDHEAEAPGEHDGHDHEAEAPGGHDGHDHETEAEGALQLSSEEEKLYGIVVEKAAAGALETNLQLTGEIALNADAVSHVVPRVGGVVREVRKSVGETVQAGETLAVLESIEVGEASIDYLAKQRTFELSKLDYDRALAVRQSTVEILKALGGKPKLEKLRQLNGRQMGENRGRLLSAYTEKITARREHEREVLLAEKKIGIETDLLAAANALHKAEAEYDALCDSLEFASLRNLRDSERRREDAAFAREAAKRRLLFMGSKAENLTRLTTTSTAPPDISFLDRIELRAPISGIVIERHISLGERLENSDNVFTIADHRTVWGNLTVFAKDLPSLKRGLGIVIENQFGTRKTSGTISLLSPLIDEATRTATARIVLDNPDGNWRPGMFVSGKLSTGETSVSLRIPKVAMQTVEGESIVFVRHKNKYETRVVRPGRSDRNFVEIVAGLAPGDEYVARGAFELKAKMVTSNLDPHAGHGH